MNREPIMIAKYIDQRNIASLKIANYMFLAIYNVTKNTGRKK